MLRLQVSNAKAVNLCCKTQLLKLCLIYESLLIINKYMSHLCYFQMFIYPKPLQHIRKHTLKIHSQLHDYEKLKNCSSTLIFFVKVLKLGYTISVYKV